MQSNNKKPVVVGIGELLCQQERKQVVLLSILSTMRRGWERKDMLSAPWETMGWGAKSSKNWIIIRSGI